MNSSIEATIRATLTKEIIYNYSIESNISSRDSEDQA